jgi:hypothetical protein
MKRFPLPSGPEPTRPLAPAVRAAACAAVLTLLSAASAHAFCGFFVATGDSKIFNKSSAVAMVRDGDRTVLTMASDFRGDPREFALVVPVPTVLQREQIHVGEQSWVDHLDQFSAPRLVEYFDPDPCVLANLKVQESMVMANAPRSISQVRGGRADELSVKIEAKYTVGEYDILILSATQSAGLETWLNRNGYRVPPGAARVLSIYLKQGMKFFVAKVNLGEKAKTGVQNLRPLQMAYESAKFMLPIRLGMANADGPQEMFVYALTKTGRVECTNYRTVKLPSDAEIPEYVKGVFPSFYRAMFDTQTRKENLSAVFLEYAWDMSWCDPCASPPLAMNELQGLGVWWLSDPSNPGQWNPRAQNASTFLTRLHIRYDAAHFPEDLVFQQTDNRENFQGRFVLRHAFTGDCDCDAGRTYKASLRERRAKEAQTLASLTGWDLGTIRDNMGVNDDWSRGQENLAWWQRIWKK